jgi:nitroreductase/chorismate mutase
MDEIDARSDLCAVTENAQAVSRRLVDARNEIDSVDTELVRVLSTRLALVVSASEYKSNDESVDDATRVRSVLDHVRFHASRLGADPDVLEVIFRVIIDQGIKLQNTSGRDANFYSSSGSTIEGIWSDHLLHIMSTMRAMRRLDDRPIPEELLNKLVQAASWAPIGANRQDYRFIVVTDRRQLVRLAPHWSDAMNFYLGALCPPKTPEEEMQFERVRAAMTYQRQHFTDIPALIVICYEPISFWHRVRSNPSGVIKQLRSLPPSKRLRVLLNLDRWASRAGAASVYPAVENLLLAARAYGLGATLTTWHSAFESEFKTVLKIPRTVDIYAIVPVGYPLGRFGPVRRRPVEELRDHECWVGRAR